jgi:hypothetical protein
MASRVTIKLRKLLSWFSQRSPNYLEDYRSVNQTFGHFPQLVNQIENPPEGRRLCRSHHRARLPQSLFSRFTVSPMMIDPAKDRPDAGVSLPQSLFSRFTVSPMMIDPAKDRPDAGVSRDAC